MRSRRSLFFASNSSALIAPESLSSASLLILANKRRLGALFAPSLALTNVEDVLLRLAIYNSVQLRFCLNEFLDGSMALLNHAGHGILHRFIDRHLGSDRYSRATLTDLLEGGPSVSLHRPLSSDSRKSPVGLILHNFHCAFHWSARHAIAPLDNRSEADGFI